MTDVLKALFVQTIVAPADAARMLMGLGLRRETGWTILVLACVLNTLAYFVSTTLFPIPPEFSLPLLASPGLVLVLLFSVMVVTVFMLFWTGRALKGAAAFGDILIMIGWLQFMRLAVQVVALVLMIILPGVAGLFAMATGLYGIWILVNFVNVAHGFDALGKSFLMLVLSVLGMTMGLSVILSLIGVTAIGIL